MYAPADATVLMSGIQAPLHALNIRFQPGLNDFQLEVRGVPLLYRANVQEVLDFGLHVRAQTTAGGARVLSVRSKSSIFRLSRPLPRSLAMWFLTNAAPNRYQPWRPSSWPRGAPVIHDLSWLGTVKLYIGAPITRTSAFSNSLINVRLS